MTDLDARLTRWVDAGLISLETAAELRRYELEHPELPPAAASDGADVMPAATPVDGVPAVGGVAAPPGPPRAPAEQPRAIAVLGEVLGYLGAALTVSALSFLVSRAWPDLAAVGRIGLVAGLLAIVAVAGAFAGRATPPPAQRLASVLLVATVALAGWLAWVVVGDTLEVDDEPTGVAVTGTMAVVAAGIYALRRRGLAQIALLVTVAAFIAAAVEPWNEGSGVTWMGSLWFALGVAWAGLGVASVLTPRTPALITGGLLGVLGLQVLSFELERGWVLTGAVVFAAALIVVSLARRPLAVLLIPGGVGLLVSVPQLVEHVVGDALATWLGVLGTGIGLVIAAVWMVRGRRAPAR